MDSLALGLLAIGLSAVVLFSLRTAPTWQPDAPPRAPWCPAGEVPTFRFGFAQLATHLGDLMGQPTECEHGDNWTSDTRQKTTTGLAEYQWCRNTPMFTRGPAHWMLTGDGVIQWTDDVVPRAQPIVRTPDMRRPCAP